MSKEKLEVIERRFKMEDLLKEVITEGLNELKDTNLESNYYNDRAQGIAKLIEKRIELDKFETERFDKENEAIRQRELDEQKKEIEKAQLDLQKKQVRATKINTALQVAATVGVAVLGAVVTVWGTNVTLEFEQEGIVTSSAGKNFVGRLFNSKK